MPRDPRELIKRSVTQLKRGYGYEGHIGIGGQRVPWRLTSTVSLEIPPPLQPTPEYTFTILRGDGAALEIAPHDQAYRVMYEIVVFWCHEFATHPGTKECNAIAAERGTGGLQTDIDRSDTSPCLLGEPERDALASRFGCKFAS